MNNLIRHGAKIIESHRLHFIFRALSLGAKQEGNMVAKEDVLIGVTTRRSGRIYNRNSASINFPSSIDQKSQTVNNKQEELAIKYSKSQSNTRFNNLSDNKSKTNSNRLVIDKNITTNNCHNNLGKQNNSDTRSSVSPDRPFSLPPGKFRPKQSLGQNFLSDQNYVNKIVGAMPQDLSEQGHRVVEIGPGAGALTRVLLPIYPMMTAIEIDQRAVAFLKRKLPSLNVVHQDVLTVDWAQICRDRGGRVNVIGNLPYYIVSQVLFSLADARNCIGTGTFTMQKEVASRIMSRCGSKAYGIPSVVFQLFSRPTFHFDIPPTVFFPPPKVDSALVSFDFTKQHEGTRLIDEASLRKVLLTTFNRRRKMIRQSFKDVAAADGVTIPEKWSTKRPDELQPAQFIDLTLAMYGTKEDVAARRGNGVTVDNADDVLRYESIWRKNFYELLKEGVSNYDESG